MQCRCVGRTPVWAEEAGCEVLGGFEIAGRGGGPEVFCFVDEVVVALAEELASVLGLCGAGVAAVADQRLEFREAGGCKVIPVFDEGQRFAHRDRGVLEAVEEV